MTKAPWKFVQVDIMQVKVYLKPTELYTQWHQYAKLQNFMQSLPANIHLWKQFII